MRSTISRKSIAAMYTLGLVWFVSVMGATLTLLQPMTAFFETIGVESVVVQTIATTTLAVLLATAVTYGVAMVLRATTRQETAAHQA